MPCVLLPSLAETMRKAGVAAWIIRLIPLNHDQQVHVMVGPKGSFLAAIRGNVVYCMMFALHDGTAFEFKQDTPQHGADAVLSDLSTHDLIVWLGMRARPVGTVENHDPASIVNLAQTVLAADMFKEGFGFSWRFKESPKITVDLYAVETMFFSLKKSQVARTDKAERCRVWVMRPVDPAPIEVKLIAQWPFDQAGLQGLLPNNSQKVKRKLEWLVPDRDPTKRSYGLKYYDVWPENLRTRAEHTGVYSVWKYGVARP